MNKKLIFALSLVLATTVACSDDKDNKPVVGESFFENKQENLAPGEAASVVQNFVGSIPAATANKLWLRNGYIPSENISASVKGEYDSESIGEDPKRGLTLTSGPIVAEGMVFTLGGQGELEARNVGDISKKVWETKVSDSKGTIKKSGYLATLLDSDAKIEFIGGNIVYSNSVIYVTTRRGSIIAIDAKTGKRTFAVNADAQIRSTPVISGDKIIFTTTDNQTIAASTVDGKIFWRHQGLVSNSEFQASPAPLLVGDKVIVTYSSGEIFELNVANGSEVWNSTVSKSAFGTLNNLFGDISQSPVYAHDTIYVVSSDGTMSGLNSAGHQAWVLEGKSISKAPWPVQDILFTTTQYGEGIAISAKSGKVIWQKELAKKKDIEDDNIIFSSFVMVNGSLFAADSNGKLHQYSAKDGAEIKTYDIPENVYLAPVVAEGKIYLLSNDSKLIEVK